MPQSPSQFIWVELTTTDLDAAKAFYADVVGWRPEAFGGVDFPYIVMKVGDAGVGGLMTIQADAAAMGATPAWLGYIHAADVDAATASLEKAGGRVHKQPADIPDTGRFSVVSDPQGAMFMLMTPQGPEQPPAATGTPGHVGWRDLTAAEWTSAFDFYAGQFGWTMGDAIDMGPMGTYQLFHAGGPEPVGAFMNKPDDKPRPMWNFYFNVEAIDAAQKRVERGGGAVLMGPVQVPGGQWVIDCKDPQGATFGLVAEKR